MKLEKKSLSTSTCADLRAAYNNCFNRWYSEKFLKGQYKEDEDCVSEWHKYRDCLSKCIDDKHLSRFLEAEGRVDFAHRADLKNPEDVPN